MCFNLMHFLYSPRQTKLLEELSDTVEATLFCCQNVPVPKTSDRPSGRQQNGRGSDGEAKQSALFRSPGSLK